MGVELLLFGFAALVADLNSAAAVVVNCESANQCQGHQATRTVPIVFVIVPDRVGSGFVKSLSRPGGNATCFHAVRIQPERQMVGVAQTDCARRYASGDSMGSLCPRRDWPIRRHPV